MDNCLFCKMVTGSIKPDVIYEDDDILAFKDRQPQAPVHILVIPKKHFSTLNDLTRVNSDLMGKLVLGAQRVAQDAGIAESGYRTVINCNAQGGQSVYHLHMHVLGGRQMGWPPG